ncbi:MAG: murein transglycosylase A, partial [Moorea sp. SIO2B7]|nr:murein transglycosylase A [Moorena sp. SIO2B7]
PGKPGDRQRLLRAINYSLRYLNTNSAVKAYQDYPVRGITRDRVRRSLIRFRELLLYSRTPAEFQRAVEREFVFYQSVGHDNQGTVSFTGYFVPVYRGSRKPTPEYRYPLYRKPRDFGNWAKPHPTRAELEGEDGLLGKQSPLSGSELVWLRDRLEAFLIQVQGSGKLELTDGKIMTVGYGGSTDYSYTSIGRELVKDEKVPQEGMSLPVLIDYFQANPLELNEYLPRNNRFIFFQETKGAPPRGSLGVPVTPDRSIATDKSLMPPGALALIRTPIPYLNQSGELEAPLVSRYVLDQDTGSAIKGAGRVDIFLGGGKVAGDRAGMIDWTGQLYYLLLRN